MTAQRPAGALPADAAPYLRLAAAIRDALDVGLKPQCTGSNLPTSDDAEDRRRAVAELCPGCPVYAECFAAGRNETFGVWAVDRTTCPGRKAPQRRQEPRQ